MKRRVLFTIDIDKLMAESGLSDGRSYGTITVYDAASGERTSKPEPKAPSIVPDENGRLRLD